MGRRRPPRRPFAAGRYATDYAQAVSFLNRHIGLGWRPGLERISRLLEMMGSPQRGYPIIHVAGTNGKTSVTLMAAAVIEALGLKSGSYISPHLERVEERYGAGGETASPEDFAQAVADVAPFADLLEAETGERPTYFELATAAAFAFFAGTAVDAAAVEVGMGGRLDATNAVAGEVAVLTGAGLDHTEHLGEGISQIAGEKLAIVEPDSALVTGPLPEEAEVLAGETAVLRRARWSAYLRDFRLGETRMAVGGWHMDLEGVYGFYPNLFLPLQGRYQTVNAAVAVAAVEEMLGRELPEEEVRRGLESVRVPGRMEAAGREPLVIIDGAHNPQAAAGLAAALQEETPSLEWTLVVGAMSDKDLPAMLEPYGEMAVRAVATAADNPRALPPAEVMSVLERALPGRPVASEETVAAALERALAETGGSQEAVLVFGSLYVAGEARAHLRRP